MLTYWIQVSLCGTGRIAFNTRLANLETFQGEVAKEEDFVASAKSQDWYDASRDVQQFKGFFRGDL